MKTRFQWPEPSLPPINLWNAPKYLGVHPATARPVRKPGARMVANAEVIARLTRR